MRTRKNLVRLSLLAMAATTLVGALAGPSHAASVGGTVQVVGGKVVYNGAGNAANHIEVMRGGDVIIVLETNTAFSITAGTGCERINDNNVHCPVRELEVNLNGGSDRFTVGGPQAFGIVTTVRGGDGIDTYQGGRDPGSSRVSFSGGPGAHDTADYSRATSRVLVDLGTQAGNDADDGRDANGDADNIRSDVETLTGSDFADSLRGNEQNNQLLGGKGRDALRGGPGDDLLYAYVPGPPPNYIVTPEADSTDLSCGAGTDTIYVDSADPAASECETRQLVG
jgi:Ca2+-binding RTX toxin-like protein